MLFTVFEVKKLHNVSWKCWTILRPSSCDYRLWVLLDVVPIHDKISGTAPVDRHTDRQTEAITHPRLKQQQQQQQERRLHDNCKQKAMSLLSVFIHQDNTNKKEKQTRKIISNHTICTPCLKKVSQKIFTETPTNVDWRSSKLANIFVCPR